MNIIKRNYLSIKSIFINTVQCIVKYFTDLYLHAKCYIFVGHKYEYSKSYWKTWQQSDDEFYTVRKGHFEEYKCKHCGYTKTILKRII